MEITHTRRVSAIRYPTVEVKNSHSGFTLIELLLYVAVASMLLFATSAYLSILLQARIKNQTIAEVEGQGVQVLQAILQAARNAEAITAPAAGASASSLTLDVLTAANDPTVFDLSNGVIRIKEGTGAVVSLTNSRVTASSLTVENLSRSSTPGTVRISFTLTHSNPSSRNEYDFSKTFYGSASLRQP